MRKRYITAFKAQVVLELLKEEKTVNQLAAEHGVHPTQLRDWKKQVLEGLPNLFEAAPEAARRFVNPRKLSPRQQVQFFYLAMLRRSGERGLPRRAAQTPYEYARTLKSQLLDVDEDVTAMTDEFIEARYSRHEITPEKVGLVRRAWEHIKQALKR